MSIKSETTRTFTVRCDNNAIAISEAIRDVPAAAVLSDVFIPEPFTLDYVAAGPLTLTFQQRVTE